MRRGDQQHVRAMGSECAAANRAGDDAGKIQYPDAAQRAFGFPKRFGRRVTDLLNGERRKRGDCLGLRMAVPLRESAARRNGKSGCRCRRFQLFRRPAFDGALHGSVVMRAVQELKQPAAMMRQVGVQSRPASVTATIKPGDIVVILTRLVIDTQIPLAAKLYRCVAQIHADMLPPASALPP
jgi:hypothetical protein